MTRALSKVRLMTSPRRGLSREEAAMYLGISTGTFDELRKTGRVGAARLIGGRKLWDIRDLDVTFDELPRDDRRRMGEGWEDCEKACDQIYQTLSR